MFALPMKVVLKCFLQVFVGVYVGSHANTYAVVFGGQRLTLGIFLTHSLPSIFMQGLSLNLESVSLANLASQCPHLLRVPPVSIS